MTGTKPCTPHIKTGRMRKADQFLQAYNIVLGYADDETDVADACVTLAVHAGIAAADVICCARLARHATGDNHNTAVSLLKTADKDSAPHLQTLLALKTRAGYTHEGITRNELIKAGRAMNALLNTARTL